MLAEKYYEDPFRGRRRAGEAGPQLREAGYERIGPPGVAFTRWGGVAAVL